MKHFFVILLFCISLSSLTTKAQQNHFIYFQTENRQPFFVKLNDKVFNSSALGYLIIAKLQDGLYNLIVGFSQSTYQQEFNCSINNKDVGFIIKNTGRDQWQLLNVETQNVLMPGAVQSQAVVIDTLPKESDPFSTMLANAVHDSTILQKEVKEIIPEQTNNVVKNDSAQILATTKVVTMSKPSVKKTIKPANHPLQSSKTIQKNIVRKAPTKKLTVITDTAHVVAVNIDTPLSKPANILANDSIAQKDVAKETIREAPKQPLQKDTTQNIVIINPVQKDSLQNVITNEVIKPSTKQKVKKKNKNIESQDSIRVQQEIIKQTDDISQTATKKQLDSATSQKNNDVVVFRSIIKRKSKKNTKDGLEMMYVDDDGEIKDTIRILIPVDKKKKQHDQLDSDMVILSDTDTSKEQRGIEYKAEKIKTQEKEPVVMSTMINSDCKNFATDEDFLKIRKKMVAETTDEDMIKVAKKTFKSRCFTTEQIKNLSVLFLKDEGKYMFFDAAYPFVSNSEKYSSLQSQLTDNYYITRFRAMIHK